MDRKDLLEAVCRDVVEKWRPVGDTTYCNKAVNEVCEAFDYYAFRGLLANEMVTRMMRGPEWGEVPPRSAQKIANDGHVVIAGAHGEEHGHVAVVFPGRRCVKSGKWPEEPCPIVANVGRTNAIVGANYAFKDKPKYWALIDEVVATGDI